VSEHDDATPRLAGGPDGVEAGRRVAWGGRAATCRQDPSCWGRGTEGLCLGAASLHPGHLRGTRPRTGNLEGPWSPATEQPGIRDSEQACLPGNSGYTTPEACPISTASWRYGLRRTCRPVTGRPRRPRSRWPNKARLPLPAVTHR